MGVAQQVGTVTAVVSGNISQGIPSGATMVVESGRATNVQTTTVYTVTAGKTLYIESVQVDAIVTGAATAIITVDADVFGTGTYKKLATLYVGGTANTSGQKATSVTLPFPITVPATKLVRVASDTVNGVGSCSIVGWEL